MTKSNVLQDQQLSMVKIILLETFFVTNCFKMIELSLLATRNLILLKRRSKSKFRLMVRLLLLILSYNAVVNLK